MSRTIQAIVSALLGVALVYLIVSSLVEFRRRAETAEERLDRICGVTRSSLQLTAHEIASNGPDKSIMIHRIFGTTDGTGRVVMQGCAPNFDRDAWTTCVEKNDEACMVKMLNEAAKE